MTNMRAKKFKEMLYPLKKKWESLTFPHLFFYKWMRARRLYHNLLQIFQGFAREISDSIVKGTVCIFP